MTGVVDTNVLLRFLVGDEERLQQKAAEILAESERGERKLVVKPVVVAEACFVLESFYDHKRERIAEVMKVFLAQRWLVVEDRKVMLGLWKWYVEGLHFVDSYLLASARSDGFELVTFDAKLAKSSRE